jgi:phosphatidylserine/phosphatidylglycerophosphate/cardiolipin synthase-like enzyme
VEVYFSPTDNVTASIAEALLSANANIEFALLAFTRDDLAEAVIDRNNDFFVTARGMIEQTSGQGGEFEVLEAAGVNVYSHEQVSGSLHHKYAIVDHSAPDSDPLVITGSHNWSSSAENVNDENTVIIHDERVANLFFQEFMARWSVFETSVDELSTFNELIAFPNPCTEQVFIENTTWKYGSRVNIEVFDLNGRMVANTQQNAGALIELNTSQLESGIYQLRIIGQNGSVGMAKLMKQ